MLGNEYVRTLVTFRLIETEQPGLHKSNRYYFLDHPWIHEGQPETPPRSGQSWRKTSAPDRQNSSGLVRQESSVPIVKEIQLKGESEKREHTHSIGANGLPQSVEEAVAVAGELHIETEFASQEYHAKKSVNWKMLRCLGTVKRVSLTRQDRRIAP